MRIRPPKISSPATKLDFPYTTTTTVTNQTTFNISERRVSASSDESQPSSRVDLCKPSTFEYPSSHESAEDTTNTTYLKPDFLGPLANTKLDSVCQSPLALLARTCQNIGQMMQQPRLNPATGVSNDIDYAVTLNPGLLNRHKISPSHSELSGKSVNCIPDSDNVTCASSTACLVNNNTHEHIGNSTLTRNCRVSKGCKLSENKPKNGSEVVQHRGKRNLSFKAKRQRLEQSDQLSPTQLSSPPSPTRNAVQEQKGLAGRTPLKPTNSHSGIQRLSTSAGLYIPQTPPIANSAINNHLPTPSSPSSEYLPDCGGADSNSSNALAQLARLSSRLPLPAQSSRLSINQHTASSYSQANAHQKLANSNWFDPLRVQTGTKRYRTAVSDQHHTATSICGPEIGHNTSMGGMAKAFSIRYPNTTPVTISLPSPSSHYDIPLVLSNGLTSPGSTITSTAKHYTSMNNTTIDNNSPTASASALSPPMSNVHSQWFDLLNALQYMGSGQQQQKGGLAGICTNQSDINSYQLAHNFLDFFYGRMKNGDFDSFPVNQPTSSPTSFPFAMELATAAFLAATSTAVNHQENEHKPINGENGNSPSHNQSSSTSSSPSSFGNNPLLSAGLPTPPQPYDPQGKQHSSSANLQQCRICGHACSDLHEFYAHVYAHLTANVNMPPQQQHAKPTASTNSVWDSPGPRTRQFCSDGSGSSQENHLKGALGDRPAAGISTPNAWSTTSLARWLANYYSGSAAYATDNEFNTSCTEDSKRQRRTSQSVASPIPATVPSHNPFSSPDHGSLPFHQIGDISDPRLPWLRVLGEHARSAMLCPALNSSNLTTSSTAARSNPNLSPWHMANAYLALFPQV